MNPADVYRAPGTDAQQRFARHCLSCSPCHRSAVSGGRAEPCNVGVRLWGEVCAEPAPVPAEHGAAPQQLLPIDGTEPYATVGRRPR